MEYRKFDVEIARSLTSGLRWPARDEASSERSLGCNRSYLDLRGMTWPDASRVFDLEETLIDRLEHAQDLDEEYALIEDELYDDDEGLFGLDIGVASTVIALSAAGCVPCSSCNAGAYGGTHHELYPTVAFFAKPKHINLLLQCALEANVGIENDSSGAVVVYADDIRNLRTFACALVRRKGAIRAATRHRSRWA
jgi:hypothetical protein